MSSEAGDISKVEGADGGGGAEEQPRRDLEEEFNVQRARLKELFLQKEEDLRQLLSDKEQLQSEVLGLRAELEQLETLSQNQKSDLLSLQLLVNETVEASSSGSEEARRLRARTVELEHQLAQLRQQQDVSIAPATLVRSIARKLGADSEDQAPKKPAEDGDLQRYEVEINALKHKLRETDTQLQEALRSKTAVVVTAPPSGDRPEPEGARACDMCQNYEKQLVLEQKEASAAKERANMLDVALKVANEELEGARSIHDETIRAWHTERASTTDTLQELKAAVTSARAALDQQAAAAQQASQRALQLVTTLTVERETLQRKLDSLDRDNAMLIGRYTKKAEEMQNEFIDLPDGIEELQLNTLELREQLICVQIGREEALSAERDLRAQLLEQGALFHRQEAELAAARAQLQQTRYRDILQLTEQLVCVQVGREEALSAERDLRAQLLEQGALFHRQEAELAAARAQLQQTRYRDILQLTEQLVCVQVEREEAHSAERDLRAHLLEQGALFHRQEAELTAARAQLQQTRYRDILQLTEQLVCVQVGREEALSVERDLRAQLLEQGALFHRQEAELPALRAHLQQTRYRDILQLTEQLVCVQIGRKEALSIERDLRAQLLEQGALFDRQEAELAAARAHLQQTRHRDILQLTEQLVCVQIGRKEALSAERDLRAQLLEQGALFHRQEGELAAARAQLQQTRYRDILQLTEQLVCVQIGREEALSAERDLRAQLLEQGALFHRQEAELPALRGHLQQTRYRDILQLTEQLVCVQIGRKEALSAERDLRAQLLEQGALFDRQEAELAAARAHLQQTRHRDILQLTEQLVCVQIGREEALSAERDLRAQLLEQGALFHRQEAELAAARAQLQQTRYRDILQLTEQLVCVQIGRKEALSAERDLRAQLLEQGALFHRQEAELAAARAQLQQTREELERLATERSQLQELGGKLRQSTDTIDSLLNDKKRMLGEVSELRGRVTALQQELDNSEKVQQDFVRLSQSLQVQLQRIREADNEVRWQFDEDVAACPSCRVPLPSNKKKVHCMHCGRIFCGACAGHAVASGPRRAMARVCAVCRTLLQPHAAPYFSTAPPTDPD